VQVVAVMMIVIFTTLNCASVAFSGQIAAALTGVKIALILFVGIGAFVWVTGDFSHFSLIANGTCENVSDSVRYGSPNYSFIAGFGAAMLGALWGYDGWNNLTFVAGEVKDPNRNIPLAIIGSTVLIILLYVFVHIGYYYVLDPTTIASVSKDSSVAKELVSHFFGGDIKSFATGLAVAIFTVGLMISSLGTLHTSILAGSRIPYALANDGLMPKILGSLSITNVPIPSLIFQGCLAVVLAFSGSFDTLTNYVIFGSWIFYGLVTSSIFVFRRRYADAERPYKAWGYPIVPIVFLLVTLWLLYNTLVTEPSQSVTGLVLIAIGLPVFYFASRRSTPPAESNDIS
jgi:APA family basic amino acid/polyamine antiporter